MVTDSTLRSYDRTGTVSVPKIEGSVILAELMCVKCGKRWTTEIPLKESLRDIRCGLCGLTGYIINTGQHL